MPDELILPEPALNVALYARVSTQRQENEETIQSQIAEIKAKIAEDGNILPEECVFLDDGWSGTVLARPALDELRDAVKKQAFKILYIYDLGRLSRDFTNQLILIKEIEEAGVTLLSLHDVNPENPEQDLQRKVFGIFHEYERIKIVDRMRRGKLYKAKNGVLINGQAPFGYNYLKKTDTTPAHCEVNEEEARVVRMVFGWVAVERISINEVVKRLYDLKIPPRKHRSEFWSKGPIVRMLKCEAYAKGKVYFNKSESVVTKKPMKDEKYRKVKKGSRRRRPRDEWLPFDVPKLIEDRGILERTTKILEDNKRYSRKNRVHDYLLRGVVYCECGCRLAGDGCNKNGHYYYRCIERIHAFPMKSKCQAKGVNAQVLDAVVWKELAGLMANPLLLMEQAKLWLSGQSNSSHSQNEIANLGKLLEKAKEEEGRYLLAYGKGALEFEQFRSSMKDVKRRKLSYQAQTDGFKSQVAVVEANKIGLDELCLEAQRVLKSLNLVANDVAEKVKIIRDLISKIVIKERKEAEVFCHIPINTLKLGHEPIGWDSRISQCREVNTF